ncbi:MAG TPA: hypothetical protein VF796_17610, partial [Humisphaera sp.]
MHLPTAALVLNLIATWYMVGLIWFVQLVHYPQFAMVGPDQFRLYHPRHTRLTTWAVGPPMLLEATTAALLLFTRPPSLPAWAAWAGACLVATLWASTAFLQVPQHNVLAGGFDARACGILCRTNWIRTVGWTARGLLMA